MLSCLERGMHRRSVGFLLIQLGKLTLFKFFMGITLAFPGPPNSIWTLLEPYTLNPNAVRFAFCWSATALGVVSDFRVSGGLSFGVVVGEVRLSHHDKEFVLSKTHPYFTNNFQILQQQRSLGFALCCGG